MTLEEEHDFYARPENQTPQGSPRRRGDDLTATISVRIPRDHLDEIRRRVGDDDRSVSAWIRQAVEDQLCRTAFERK
jgi:hypothetical protein